MCDDTFLQSLCAALINGLAYYENVKRGQEKGVWSMDFEALLHVPQKVWAVKHHQPVEEYPHGPPLSYETGSSQDGWK